MRKTNTKRVTLTYVIVSALILSANALSIHASGEWKEVNGAWAYTNEGKVLTGWQLIGNNWYAFDETGRMKTGWVASDEKWYFMGESGVMQSDTWVNDLEGSKYFIKGTGVMAADYVKDGYELDSSGKAIFMAQTTSVELMEYMDINNKIIEGNLYIDVTKFKELELNGITVTGKLVIMGEEIQDATITIKDSIINTISSQTRGAEMTLAGTTSVTNIQIEENSTIKPAADYTGKVENIEVQSTAQKEVKIEVPAKMVSSNTFATVTVNAKVDNLSVNKKTDLTVNANIKNITVNKTATDTKVEVSKGNTVDIIESEVNVDIKGSGKVDKIKGDNIVSGIKTPKPPVNDRPNPPIAPDNNVVQVGDKKYTDINLAIQEATEGQEVRLLKDITLSASIVIENKIILNGDGKSLTMASSTLQSCANDSVVVLKNTTNATIKNLSIKVTGAHSGLQGYYGIQVYNSTDVILNNIISTGADYGILVYDASTKLTGTIDVSGNEFGGLVVKKGVEMGGTTLTLESTATVVNKSETYDNPTLCVIAGTSENTDGMIGGFNDVLYKGPDIIDEVNNKNHYFGNEKFANAIVVKDFEKFKEALDKLADKPIVLSSDIDVTKNILIKNSYDINLNKHTIIGNKTPETTFGLTFAFNTGKSTVENGTISALLNIFCTIYAEKTSVVSINNLELLNCTSNGNSIKALGNSVIYVSNTKSTSYLGGGLEANGGTINVMENNSFTQTGYFNHNSAIGAASRGGTLNILEGVFISENRGLYLFNSGGTINVNGGTFEAKKEVLKADMSTTNYESIINISGGTFDGKISIAEGAFLNITGGTFMNTELDLEKFSSYVNEGFTVNEENGVYNVTANNSKHLSEETINQEQ